MVRKLMTMVAAAALAVGPTAAQAAAPLSVANSPAARASSVFDDASALRGENSTPIILGFLVLVILIAVAIGGSEDEPANSP